MMLRHNHVGGWYRVIGSILFFKNCLCCAVVMVISGTSHIEEWKGLWEFINALYFTEVISEIVYICLLIVVIVRKK